jgi:heterodisulfide reductase subunit C
MSEAPTIRTLDPGLAGVIGADAAFDAEVCMNCGVCTAVCPLDLEHLPRRVMHDASVGNRAAVVEHAEEIYSCLLCRMCEASCPAGVHITANIRALRHYLNHDEYGL